MLNAVITGWGKYTPPAVLSNSDLERVMDTTDEWITTRSGIKERRISHVDNSVMAVAAARQALAAAGLEPDDIDLIIACTCTPDRQIPSMASFIQRELDTTGCGTMDLNAACSGFVYGLSVGSSMIKAGTARRVLVIGSEKLSYLLDIEERSTGVLFGDGAGAVVLESTDDDVGVIHTELGTAGEFADILTVYGTGSELEIPDGAPEKTIVMEGREVFRQAVVGMGESAARVVTRSGWTVDDVDLLVPHQANIRIIDATARRLELPEQKVYTNIASYGNTSAASIPIALCDAIDDGRIQPGSKMVLVAFGGGLTWAAATMVWGDRTTPVAEYEHDIPGTDIPAIDLVQRARR